MITLHIHDADFPFVIEALRARADGLMAALISQAQPKQTLLAQEPVKEAPVALVAASKPKMAPKVSPKRLESLEKAAEAPYGFKKDGTPRGKPGRKTS